MVRKAKIKSSLPNAFSRMISYRIGIDLIFRVVFHLLKLNVFALGCVCVCFLGRLSFWVIYIRIVFKSKHVS